MAVSWLARFNFTNLATLFQNPDGTTPVTTVGQRVGRITDPTSGHYIAAEDTDNRWVIVDDGARLTVRSGPWRQLTDTADGGWLDGLLNNQDPWWIVACVKRVSFEHNFSSRIIEKEHGDGGTVMQIKGGAGDTEVLALERTPNEASTPISSWASPRVLSAGYTGSSITTRIDLGTKATQATAGVLSDSPSTVYFGAGIDELDWYALAVLDHYPSPEEEEAAIREIGAIAGLFPTETIGAGVGASTAAGHGARVEQGATVAAQVGAASAGGLPASVEATATIAASIGAASAAGATAQLAQTQTIAAAAGRAVASGRPASVSESAAIVSQPGTAVARGVAAVVAATVTITASVGRAVARGMQAGIAVGGAIAASAGRALAAGRQATIAIRQTLGTGTGAAMARGLPAALGATVVISAGTATAHAAGHSAAIGGAEVIACTTARAAAAGLPAALSGQALISASSAAARAAGLPALIGPADTSTGPYRATLAAFQRGAAITASTRGAAIRRIS